MATQSKQKKVKGNRQKLKLFRANEPEKSILMWGISYSTSQLNHVKPRAILLSDDFKAYLKVAIDNNQFNKDNMPSTFKFKEYSPMVFKDLRRRFCVQDRQYLESFTLRQPLRRSRAKEKRADLRTQDKRFTAKTISSEDVESIQNYIQSYYEYVVRCHANTRLPQLLGLYRLTVNDQYIYMVTMRNIYYPPGSATRKYLIKGRISEKNAGEKEKKERKQQNSMLNDEHFLQDCVRIHIGEPEKQQLLSVLQRDIEFLESQHINAFRLAIGVSGGAEDIRGHVMSDEEIASSSDDGSSSDEGHVESEGLTDMTPPDSPVPAMREDESVYVIRDVEDRSRMYHLGFTETLRRRHHHYRKYSRDVRTGEESMAMGSGAAPDIGDHSQCCISGHGKRLLKFLAPHIE